MHGADKLTTIMCCLSWNLGASTPQNPQSYPGLYSDCSTFTNGEMTINNTALSCNGHSKRNEWWLGNLAAKVCAGVHFVSQSQEGIQVWMVKLAIDTTKKADIEYIQEVLNSHEKLSVKEGWGYWSLWQRHCRILGTKKLLIVFKHFEVTRAGMDDNYEYLEINVSFQALLICFAWLWPWNLQDEKTGCQTDYTEYFLSENCRASTFNIRRYEIGNLYFNISCSLYIHI